MLDKARKYVQPILESIAKPLSFIHPNIITLIGFIAGIFFLIFMYEEMYGWALVCFIGVALDSLDGTIARMTGKDSKFGAFFDSSLDRITDALMLIGFAAAAVVSWPLMTFTLLASIMVSYTRAKAEQVSDNKIRLAVGVMERPERLGALLIATLLLVFNVEYTILEFNLVEVIFILLFVLSVITVIQRFYAAYQKLK